MVLDACVLSEAAVSDLILRLADEPNLLMPRWTHEIWNETLRTWVEKLGWDERIALSRLGAAIDCFPEAMIEGFEHLIEKCENHPKDRHVLAAAIHSRTDVIVTFNVRDFKPEHLRPWGIVAVHPADYLQLLFDHDRATATTVLEAMAAKTRRTLPEIVARLAWHVEPFSAYVAAELGFELPILSPRQWMR
ncbi:MAG: PIN domain-containing protein [Fimbriimonas sp.]